MTLYVPYLRCGIRSAVTHMSLVSLISHIIIMIIVIINDMHLDLPSRPQP